MALIKRSKLNPGTAQPVVEPPPIRPPVRNGKPNGAARRVSVPSRDKLSERLAAATEELASGLTEASAAAEELRRSMEQIASGASEAAGASQEQLSAIKQVVGSLGVARTQAEASRRRTEAAEVVLAETAVQIGTSVRAIERNGLRQGASVELITRARAARAGHRRDHRRRQPDLGPDQPARAQCRHRGGAGRRSRPRLRRRRRRSARAGRDLGEKRAGRPEARDLDPDGRSRDRHRAPEGRRNGRRRSRRPAPPS